MKTDFKTETEIAARVFGYSFLFRSFIEEPTKNFLKNLKEEDVLIYYPYIGDAPEIKKGIELIESYINQETSVDKLVDELAVDYASLFIMGTGKPLSPPWESVYLSGRGLLFQEETLEVRRKYTKYRLLPEKLNKEPDDHVGFELQFMYILAEKTAQAIESGDYKKAQDLFRDLFSDQKEFLEKHLLKWTPLFAKDVYEHAETDFYRGVATVLTGFLKTDYSKICELYTLLKTEGE